MSQLTFNLAQFNLSPLDSVDVILTPTASFPRAVDSNLITLDRIISQSNAWGSVVFDNVVGGYYNCSIVGPFTNTKLLLFVPTGSDSYNANTLIVDAVSDMFTASFVYCQSASVAGSASWSNRAGAAITSSWSNVSVSSSWSSFAASSSWSGFADASTSASWASSSTSASFSNNAETKLPFAGGTLTGDLTVSAHNLYVTGGFLQAGFVLSQYEDTSANTAPVSAEINHTTTAGTPAVNNGVSVDMTMNTDTAARQVGTRLSSTWTTASNAGRTSKFAISLVNSGTFGQVYQITPSLATFGTHVSASAFTGSHFGTSSVALAAVTASYISSSARFDLSPAYSLTSSWASGATTSSYVANVQQNVFLLKFLAGASGSYTDIGTWSTANGPVSLLMSAVANAGGFSVSKTYFINSQFATNVNSLYSSGSYKQVFPISSTGQFSPEDFQLEAMQAGATMSLRLVKTTGSAVANIIINMDNLGFPGTVWTAAAASSTGSAYTGSTGVWPSSFMKQEANNLLVSGSVTANAFTGSHVATSALIIPTGLTTSTAVTATGSMFFSSSNALFVYNGTAWKSCSLF